MEELKIYLVEEWEEGMHGDMEIRNCKVYFDKEKAFNYKCSVKRIYEVTEKKKKLILDEIWED
jgi:hypothetical protein